MGRSFFVEIFLVGRSFCNFFVKIEEWANIII